MSDKMTAELELEQLEEEVLWEIRESRVMILEK